MNPSPPLWLLGLHRRHGGTCLVTPFSPTEFEFLAHFHPCSVLRFAKSTSSSSSSTNASRWSRTKSVSRRLFCIVALCTSYRATVKTCSSVTFESTSSSSLTKPPFKQQFHVLKLCASYTPCSETALLSTFCSGMWSCPSAPLW